MRVGPIFEIVGLDNLTNSGDDDLGLTVDLISKIEMRQRLQEGEKRSKQRKGRY